MAKYGYDDAALAQIITATGAAQDQMNTVNGRVSAIAHLLPTVNASRSGQRLSAALADWNTDFNRVVAQLMMLNEKARDLLKTNRSVDNQAEGATGV
ncbi:hypothetical protein [Actinokineospora fastidiosa]|uniref:Uncharacterized protein n=1 Tax=Actinokineospora fastidiosa TaxID=1816 RepID=A0A918GD98_9PSEU|nr:hypothetical protein [Actinokineospora fastidiosa]GGS30385.1 hypothetical protein GCM10010171_24900 [Actinokineospora fastidiosa]